MTKLTAAQRKRLDKLATYLEGLPKGYRHFDMAIWLGAFGSQAVHYAQFNGGVASCATVACAAGHGPAAGILVPAEFIRNGMVYWGSYASWLAGPGLNREWLFDSDWASSDNHHHGAAARARYLLDHGSPPEGFEEPRRKWRKAYAPYRIKAPAKAGAK